MIHTRFIGRLSNNSTTNFRIKEEDLISTLASKGIKVIPTKQFSSELKCWIVWEIGFLLENQILVPWKSVMCKQNIGNVSVRFTNYINQGGSGNQSLLDGELEEVSMALISSFNLDDMK